MPAQLTKEKRLLIWRMYEVWPQDSPTPGKRRFRRVGLSMRKGLAKTELAAWIAAVELHPQGPVRCDGFDAAGKPVGRPVTDPYIPMVAYTEEQTEDLAYAALKTILELSKVSDDFDIGKERITRKGGDGKAVALAAAPDARDGARTTFQHMDETHRWTSPRLQTAARTMLANLTKRPIADPWSLATTTAYSPGEGSVAERLHEYAEEIADGRRVDNRLFFFHREASERHDVTTRAGRVEAVLEATGPDNVGWSDVDGIVDQYDDPDMDPAYWERVWANRRVQAASQAFDVTSWNRLAKKDTLMPGDAITLGFDGSRYNDATALVACRIRDSFMVTLGIWERPLLPNGRPIEGWEVPRNEVNAVIDDTMKRYRVWRMNADPFEWQSEVAAWSGQYGEKIIISFNTTIQRPMHYALKGFQNAITAGELSHEGDRRLASHLGNSVKRYLNLLDENGQHLWLIQKERPDSPKKIDGAMAATLAHDARLKAIAAGANTQSIYATRGLRVLGSSR